MPDRAADPVPAGVIGKLYTAVVPPCWNHDTPLPGDWANIILEFVCQFGVARHVQLISRVPVESYRPCC